MSESSEKSPVAPQERPISAYVKVGGLYFFARTLDKIRKHARGVLHADYHEFVGKGYDGRLCHFLGIDYAALRQRTLDGGTDEDVLAWCQAHSRKITDSDLMIWNGFAAKRGWRDEATSGLQANKVKSGLGHRDDILTFFDYYEVDEGRTPR